MHTGFCSPSSTRSFGATPFARNSLNWSAMYCVGFFFVVCVAVSDILWLPWDEFAGEAILLHAKGLGQTAGFTTRFLVTAVRSRIFGISLAARLECAPSEYVSPESVHKREESSPADNAKARVPDSNRCAESHEARTPPNQPLLPRPCPQPSHRACPRERTKPHHRYGANGAEQ